MAVFKESLLLVVIYDRHINKALRPGNNFNLRLIEDVNAL